MLFSGMDIVSTKTRVTLIEGKYIENVFEIFYNYF